MNKVATLSILLLLVASSLVGAMGLGVASPATGQHVILSPLRFQLNGRDPYTVKVPMKQGETIFGEVNSTGADVTFLVVLQGAVLQSESVSGPHPYQFTASISGTYELDFTSTESVLVSVDVYSR